MAQDAIQETSQPDFRDTELEPTLLRTAFAVQTNWHVLTGAPSCGKTTLLEGLAAEGYRTVAETARQYIASEASKGRTVAEVRADWVALQRGIMDLQRRTEKGLCARDLLFLDRGLPDCFAFCRLAGMDPNEHLAGCCRYRYASVLLLAPLPFEVDGMRMESDALIADYLAEWHARDYSALGYDIIRVPVLPPRERVAFVLKALAERGLI